MSTQSSRPGSRRVLLGVGVLALLGAGVLAAALLGGGDGDERKTAEPSPSRAVATVGQRTAAVTATPTRVPSGTAVRITVVNPDGKEVAAAPLEAYPASRGLNFSPDKGKAGWWDQGRYGAPAVKRQSVVSAHSTYDGQPDVFNRLPQTQVGAEVRVEFSGGDSARYRVTEIANAPKADVVNDKTVVGHRVWSDPGLSVVTCDLDSGTRDDGHLKGNTVLFTERIA